MTQAVCKVPPVRTLVLVVDRRHDDRHVEQGTCRPCQQVRMDHVAVEDVGSPAPEDSAKPQHTARVGGAAREAQGGDPDPGGVQARVLEREHRNDADVPSSAAEGVRQRLDLTFRPAGTARIRGYEVRDARVPEGCSAQGWLQSAVRAACAPGTGMPEPPVTRRSVAARGLPVRERCAWL